VLPRHYTALVDAQSRRRAEGLRAWFDLLSRRFSAKFVRAGSRSRPTRDPQPAQRVLQAAIGMENPALEHRLSTPLQTLLYHAGHLASRTRSADRLVSMLSEEAGSPVRIVEFTGTWTRLPATEQTRLLGSASPGQHARLGVDAVLGSQAWDPAASFRVVVGPLSLGGFRAFLPGAALHERLVDLTRLHVGLEQTFAINPVLAPSEVPALRLGPTDPDGARLGWTSWLVAPRSRTSPAADAVLLPMASTPTQDKI
jgi:type VI secretion system protein ImpH